MDPFPDRQAAAKGCVSKGAVSRHSGWQKRWTHCRFTTFTASWKYSKWTNPSGANPTTVAGTRTPLEQV